MGAALEKFEEGEVNISILGRNIQITQAIREHIDLRLRKIMHMCSNVMNIKVYLEIQKDVHKAEIVLHFSHFHLIVHAQEEDLYQAFDHCYARLKGKLRKWKTKIQEHHEKKISSVEMDFHVLDRKREDLIEINDMIEEENFHQIEEELAPLRVNRREKRKILTLTMDEASMRFDFSCEPFLVYREETDQKIKVMCYDKNHELTVLELE
jgi:putative sigma-54 modulation protein